MSYQALYRVWRPQRFEDMVGQDVITKTLKNALITDQTSHAYLFTGPRGTGKTSAAKIFAKAVNCHHLKDGEPCNECESCKAITNGSMSDVIEIDAASNNGVEEIRDIRDKAKYAPTEADYKVYIIDEVHMLSTGAFNALLKTLEEPPANVIFILATTEPQKIPLTIISRTQRFDFKRISAQEAYDRMVYILDEKKITFDPKALQVVARAAEGGMRDALSILDQVLSFGDNEVTLENALLVTGSVNQTLLDQYIDQIFKKETAQGLETLHQILNEGKDGQRLIEDLIEEGRNLLLYQQDPKLVEQQHLGELSDQFKSQAQDVDSVELYQMIDILNDTQQQMRFTTHPDVYLEVLTIKLTNRQVPAVGSTITSNEGANGAEVDQLKKELSVLQQQMKELKKNPPVAATNITRASEPRKKSVAKKGNSKKTPANLTKIYPILDTATKNNLVELRDVWKDLMNMLSVTQRALMHVSRPVAASKSGVVVSFSYDFLFEKAVDDSDLRSTLENDLERLTGAHFKVTYVTDEDWPQVRSGFIQARKNGDTSTPDPEIVQEETVPDEPEQTVEPNDKSDKVVDEAVAIFGDENIEIKND